MSKAFMHCDRCNKTFAQPYSSCTYCGSGLREFEVEGLSSMPSYSESVSTSSIKLGESMLAKYPFLSEAGALLRGIDLSILDRPESARVIEKAGERILEAMDRKENYRVLDNSRDEILCFTVCLIIAKFLGIPKIVNKFSLWQAQRIETFIIRDLLSNLDKELKDALTGKIFKGVAGVDLLYSSYKGIYAMSVPDYLMLSASIKEDSWKITARPVVSGKVLIEDAKAPRLLREVMFNVIRNKINGLKLASLPKQVGAKVEELRTKIKVDDYYQQQVHVGAYPPCVTHLLGMLERGENVPDSGRVFLATYMISIGKQVEFVIDLFRNAPDFSEKTTRYHVEHLAGLKGSSVKYSPANCEKMKLKSLCFATDQCAGITHPLQFGRNR